VINRKKINLALLENLPSGGTPLVSEAMRYSLEAEGKRLRPILTIAVAETLGKESTEVMEVACALEYIHTYSLIHDDLPAMDNSDLRRGKATSHRVYGEDIAILAGDALLTAAFGVVARYGSKAGSEKKAIRIVAELAAAAGVEGMVGGQELDLKAEGKEPDCETVVKIAALKTGALLRAAVLCGAIAADASPDEEQALRAYAEYAGSAFQITDDLLDYESTTEILGKPAGADQNRAKATYPAFSGIAEAKNEAQRLHAKALQSLDKLNRPAALLSGLAGKMVFRSK
jgi:geranylgeranyl diphosphate synthase, type II